MLLGSSSFDELVDRLDTADRVSAQDARIISEVRTFRAEVKRREAALARARQRQEQVVAEREARKAAVQAKLAERQQLLASIKDQIEKMKAQEAAQQRRLEAQAEARLAASTPTPTPTPTAVSKTTAPPSRYGGVVGIAMQYLGTPYHWGGASPETGFDCSGFTMFVFSQIGVSLPHNAAMQYGYGSAVDRSQLAPGDLVFFDGLGHVGIYIGGNQFIHSPHTGDVVKISTITGWYASTWVGARRL